MKKTRSIVILLAAALLLAACSGDAPTGASQANSNSMMAAQSAAGTSAPAPNAAQSAPQGADDWTDDGADESYAEPPTALSKGSASSGETSDDAAEEAYSPYDDESYAPIYESGFVSPLDKPLSTFSADVDTAAYTNIRRRIENGQSVDADMVRIEEMINYFHYDYPEPMGDSPLAISTDLGPCPWNPEHRLALIGLKAADIREDEAPPVNLVFLIDVSGSMDMDNKLPLVKRAFGLLVDELTPRDRVSIVTYASADTVVLYGATGDEKAAIRRAIEDLSAGGGTHASSGITTAYEIARSQFIEGGSNRVILATDGDFNVGVTDEAALQRLIEGERDDGVFLTVLGFGMGNYKDSKVETLAKHGNGNYAYVDNLQAARKVLVDELGATLHTVAKDVKLQVEFNPATVQAYRLIGYEHRMLRDEDFRDDAKDAGDIGAGHTVTALYEIIPAGASSQGETLKYQPDVRVPTGGAGTEGVEGELLTVKIRCKAPDADFSDEIAAIIDTASYSGDASDNLRLAGAVAEFGLLLRGSEFRGGASASGVLDALRPLATTDPYGYVRDLQALVERYGR